MIADLVCFRSMSESAPCLGKLSRHTLEPGHRNCERNERTKQFRVDHANKTMKDEFTAESTLAHFCVCVPATPHAVVEQAPHEPQAPGNNNNGDANHEKPRVMIARKVQTAPKQQSWSFNSEWHKDKATRTVDRSAGGAGLSRRSARAGRATASWSRTIATAMQLRFRIQRQPKGELRKNESRSADQTNHFETAHF